MIDLFAAAFGGVLAGWYVRPLLECRPDLSRRSTTPKPDIVPKGSASRPSIKRVYLDCPARIAECGGPCSFGGPELCDCGALWRDVPIKPQFPSPRVIPGDLP